jgi:hypothetical protein
MINYNEAIEALLHCSHLLKKEAEENAESAIEALEESAHWTADRYLEYVQDSINFDKVVTEWIEKLRKEAEEKEDNHE